MKIVMFARTPSWYGFSADRLTLSLRKNGIELSGIVVETTSTISSLKEWIKKLGFKLVVQKSAQRLGKVITGRFSSDKGVTGAPEENPVHIPITRVSSHNSEECRQAVLELSPDIILVRGCGILREPIIDVANIGVINPHYAVLPEYRGVDVTEWSVLHGDPCAVSVHWVTKDVDGGAVIVSDEIDTKRANSLGELRERCAEKTAELFVVAIKKIRDEKLRPVKETELLGNQYFNMHPRLYAMAEKRLFL